MLGLDAAVIFAGLLVSRVVGYGDRRGKISWPCLNAIENQADPSHWGQNLVQLMNKFATDISVQKPYARNWDSVRHERFLTAQPPWSEYDEGKAMQLSSHWHCLVHSHHY